MPVSLQPGLSLSVETASGGAGMPGPQGPPGPAGPPGLISDVLAAGGSPVTVTGASVKTVDINAAGSGNRGSQSVAHYNLVQGATSNMDASSLVKRDASGTIKNSLSSVPGSPPIGLALENLVAATAGPVNQNSPSAVLTGQGWNGSASVANDWAMHVEASGLTSALVFRSQIAGGGYQERGRLSSSGDLTASGSLKTPVVDTVMAADQAFKRNGTLIMTTKTSGLVLAAGLSVLAASFDQSAASPLTVGASNATSLALAQAGVTTTVQGPLTVAQGLTFSSFGTGIVHSNGSGVLSSSLIVDADVSNSAAISGLKVAPAFGAQLVSSSTGFQGPSLDTSGVGTLVLGGANATAMTIGSGGIVVTVPGNLTVQTFGTGIVHSNGSGVLSSSALTFAEVNVALAAASSSVSLNGQTLTAGGFLTDGSVDRATAGAGSLWAVTATSGSIGKVSFLVTIMDSVTIKKDAIGAADSIGLLLDNTTSTGTTEQRAPTLRQRGYGHKTSSGGSQVLCYAERSVHFVDNTSNPDVEITETYSQSGSGGTFGKWTTNLPGLGGVGLSLNSTIVLGSGSNGVRGSGTGNPGININSNDIQVKTGASDGGVDLRSSRTDTGNPIRSYADAEARGATKRIHSFGDLAGGVYTERAAVMGDGTYNGPFTVVTAAPKTANYTAVARDEIWLDPTGGAFNLTLPTAVGAQGKPIVAHMSAASANVVTLNTTGGQTISGSASGALTLGNAVSIETGRFSSDGSNWWFERASTVL